jgi:hypothetical protein
VHLYTLNTPRNNVVHRNLFNRKTKYIRKKKKKNMKKANRKQEEAAVLIFYPKLRR